MQTRTFARVVATLRVYWRHYLVAGLVAMSLAVPRARAATASNTLPQDSWRARAPNRAIPPVPLAVNLGNFPSADEAFLALDAYAVNYGPLTDKEGRKFSSGLIEAPLGAMINFDPDADDDGEIDLHVYAEPLSEFGAFPRNCSSGTGALFPTGGQIAWTSALVYEPAVGIDREPGPLIKGLCGRAYCQEVSGCGRQGPINWFLRRAVTTFVAQYDPSRVVCDSDRKAVFEDLLGRRSNAQSCEVVGGLNNDANLGGDCPALANGSNPVNTVTGNKFQRELDYAGTVHGELRFVRYYNSQLTQHQDIGLGWRHSYSATLTLITARNGDESARLTRADGRVLIFNRPTGSARFTSDPLTVGTFARVAGTSNYEYVDGDDVRERYDYVVTDTVSRGSIQHLLLASRHDPRSGRREILSYDAHRRLTTVAGRFGRSLRFSHDSEGRLREFTDAAGRQYSYLYDRLGRLRSVTYPDLDDNGAEPASRANNPVRAYRYEDPDWPKGLTGIVDESGTLFAHWDYDGHGRAVLSEHAGGAQRVSFDYQASYTAITDALGQTRSYNTAIEYGVGLVTAVTGGDCNFCGAGPLASTSYDANGHRNLVSDHQGNVTDFDYDASGLQLRKSEGSGTEQRITTTTWLPDARLPHTQTVADGAGHLVRRLTNEYWGAQIKRRIEEDLLAGGASRITTYHYFGEEDISDPRYGLLKRVDGPRTDVADTTDHDYDATTGNLLRTTDALGHVTRYPSHDAEGRVLTAIDANGMETRFEYDARGHLIARIVAGAETRMTYDARGLMSTVMFPDKSTQSYRYDAAQRLTRIEDARGNAVEYTLDALGNRTAERHLDRAGKVVSHLSRIYNRHNQIEQLMHGVYQATGFAYDDNGRLQSVIDPRGGGLTSRREYDSLGRVREFTDALGGITQLNYDHNGQSLAVTDPRGLVTRYRRDGLGRLLGTESPDAGVKRHEFDAAGNRTEEIYQQKRGVDIAIAYQYDALNRLTRIDYPTDADVFYGYDEDTAERRGVGRLTSMRDASGMTAFAYDLRGNLASRRLDTIHGSFAIGYQYDSNDRVSGIRYPSGLVVTLGRDAAGEVTSIQGSLGALPIPIVTDIDYHALGAVASMRLGSGIAEQRRYDDTGRLTAIESSATHLPSFRYPAYDAIGNLLRVEESFVENGVARSIIRNYRYDELSRLVFDDNSQLGTARHYSYDSNGNRTAYRRTSAAGALLSTDTLYVEALSNRVHAAPTPGTEYDAAGNMTHYVVPPRLNSGSGITRRYNADFAYNESGRLTRTVNVGSTLLMESTYNGHGERVIRKGIVTDGQPEVLLYGEGGAVLSAARVNSGKPTEFREYIWLAGRPVAEIHVIAGQSRPRVNFIHSNHLNQPLYMSGSSGLMTWSWRVGDAFGFDAGVSPDPDGDRVSVNPVIGGGFPGQVADGLLFNNGFRDYDPMTGRYVQVDPVGLDGGMNPYAYAGLNPIGFVDPDGLTQCDVDTALDIANRRLTGRKLPSPAKGEWRAPENVEIVAQGQIDRIGRHGETGKPPSAASRRWGDEWIDTLLNPRYGECLSDADARDLFDTVIHEGAHWGAPANAPYQYDSNRSTGFAYTAAREFGTPDLVDEYVQARQKCRCICEK